MSDTIGRKMVATRKEHVCFGCGRKFPKGVHMERSCVVGGGAWTCYMCESCLEVEKTILDSPYEFGFSDLREDALELERAKAKVSRLAHALVRMKEKNSNEYSKNR